MQQRFHGVVGAASRLPTYRGARGGRGRWTAAKGRGGSWTAATATPPSRCRRRAHKQSRTPHPRRTPNRAHAGHTQAHTPRSHAHADADADARLRMCAGPIRPGPSGGSSAAVTRSRPCTRIRTRPIGPCLESRRGHVGPAPCGGMVAGRGGGGGGPGAGGLPPRLHLPCRRPGRRPPHSCRPLLSSRHRSFSRCSKCYCRAILVSRASLVASLPRCTPTCALSAARAAVSSWSRPDPAGGRRGAGRRGGVRVGAAAADREPGRRGTLLRAGLRALRRPHPPAPGVALRLRRVMRPPHAWWWYADAAAARASRTRPSTPSVLAWPVAPPSLSGPRREPRPRGRAAAAAAVACVPPGLPGLC
jgi:hypothetical protein